MSCLYNAGDWSRFQPRPEPLDPELLSPARELATLLQHHHTELDRQRQAAERAVADALSIAAGQAVLVFHLANILRCQASSLESAGLDTVLKQLWVLHDQMLAGLVHGELSISDPAGAAFGDVAGTVTVVGWRHSIDFPEEVVAETLEPVVLHGGKAIRHGRVVMGAPNEPTT